MLMFQGGLYLLQLQDEYISGFPLMLCAVTMCLGLAWVYGLQRFCQDIEHMIGSKVAVWWKLMWTSVTPIVILVCDTMIAFTNKCPVKCLQKSKILKNS
jgi:solute carrier family 6 amino acid transporter-like protein 5/7/9/14